MTVNCTSHVEDAVSQHCWITKCIFLMSVMMCKAMLGNEASAENMVDVHVSGVKGVVAF